MQVYIFIYVMNSEIFTAKTEQKNMFTKKASHKKDALFY